MSEQKPEADKQKNVETTRGNSAGDTYADVLRVALAQQGIQAADVNGAVKWARQPVDTQHDQPDDTADGAASIKP